MMDQSPLLTAQERERFAGWLEREVESAKGMIAQMGKMSGLAPMIEKEKRWAAACLIVARHLRNTEDMTIGV